ncbi:MAG: hypothetical protein ABIP78_01380 [Pyrinomonadaceae bacterium]
MKAFCVNKIVGPLCVILLLACGARIASSQANPPSAAEKREAERAWESLIKAKGGRERLFAINNLLVTTRGQNSNDEKQFQNTFFEDLYVLPGRWWEWVDQRPGFPLSVAHLDFAKEIGYETTEVSNKVVTFRPKTPRLPDESVSILKLDGSTLNENFKQRFLHNQMIYLMETRWFQPAILSVRTDRRGFKKVEVVVASFSKKKYEYFLDPKTDLPSKIKVTTCFVDLPTCGEDTFYLSDYIEVAGVKFPQVVSRGKGDDSRTTYQVNVPYNEKLFDSPPSIAAGPDAWKPKSKAEKNTSPLRLNLLKPNTCVVNVRMEQMPKSDYPKLILPDSFDE